MYPPEGYNYKNKILKLKKAIYDIKTGTPKMEHKIHEFSD